MYERTQPAKEGEGYDVWRYATGSEKNAIQVNSNLSIKDVESKYKQQALENDKLIQMNRDNMEEEAYQKKQNVNKAEALKILGII